MRRLFLSLVLTISLTALGQTDSGAVKFGYLSYEAALRSMPEYVFVLDSLRTLQAQYDAEAKRVEDEFNKKYEEFLDGQKEFPKTILHKRQNELQELMARNIAFKEDGRRQLAVAREEALAPLRERLAAVLARIGQERGYALILNTDQNACPFISPVMGEDINQQVQDALQ